MSVRAMCIQLYDKDFGTYSATSLEMLCRGPQKLQNIPVPHLEVS
jgi:hypothetical protein